MTTKSNSNENEVIKISVSCKSCKTSSMIEPDDYWYDESGYGYSTKLCKCPNCNKIIIMGHKEDYGFSKLNTDKRYF